ILSPRIIIIAVKSILKGYFYGVKKVHIPALSDIFEQIVRIVLVFGLFYYIQPNDIGISASIIVIGMVVGELISLLFIHTRFYNISKEDNLHITPRSSYRPIINSLYKIALPITSTRVILSIVSSIGSVLVPQRLVSSGLSPAQALKSF